MLALLDGQNMVLAAAVILVSILALVINLRGYRRTREQRFLVGAVLVALLGVTGSANLVQLAGLVPRPVGSVIGGIACLGVIVWGLLWLSQRAKAQ